MFISGLSNNYSQDTNTKLSNVSDSDIVLIFDAVENYSISMSNEKTSFPIESRSSISDHVYCSDGKLSFTGRVSSSPTNIRDRVEWDRLSFPESPKAIPRIRDAYDVVKAARDSKAKISLFSEEFDLVDYVITSFEFTRDGPLEVGVFNITMEEFRIRTIGTTVLATNVGVEAGKSNKNTGSEQSGSVSELLKRRDVTVQDTKNRTTFYTDLFKSEKLYESIPQDQVTPKLTLGQ